MEKTIVPYGSLREKQKAEAVELFLVGFGRFMSFSRDEALKRKLFLEILDPDWFFCCLEGEKVLGLMGLGTREKRPICFRPELCRELFGALKGALISKQMNAVFQSRAVSGNATCIWTPWSRTRMPETRASEPPCWKRPVPWGTSTQSTRRFSQRMRTPYDFMREAALPQ